ncbi:MAG: rRNA maturation RNase YbeY [Pyrinomonadaceae bacterium]|nr:rRNA maturation RNase YbeY [Pyrinomonadaceae bacterium]
MSGGAVEVVNRQRGQQIDRERWQAFGEQALEMIGVQNQGATVLFTSDRTMRKLNRDYRGKDCTTDVLSFPSEQTSFEKASEKHLGDVVISVEQASRQAAEHRLEMDREVAQLILHGLLHLCGYDHATDNGEMNRLELRLRRRLGI